MSRIAQCLCGPARHAILALGINDDALGDEEAVKGLRWIVEMLAAGRGQELVQAGIAIAELPTMAMNAWCALCGAKPATWIYEIRPLVEYQDWETALHDLRRREAEQQLLRIERGLPPGSGSVQ